MEFDGFKQNKQQLLLGEGSLIVYVNRTSNHSRDTSSLEFVVYRLMTRDKTFHYEFCEVSTQTNRRYSTRMS